MSPEKNKKLKKLRLDLDKIDDKLIKIIKKRFKIVKSVLLLKTKKKEIIDKKRIKIIQARPQPKSWDALRYFYNNSRQETLNVLEHLGDCRKLL